MIYVDDIFAWTAEDTRDPQARRVGARHGHRWCHLWCDEGEEEQLHALAAKVGMKRQWFQNKPGFPHYDLVPTKRAAAIKHGANEKPLLDWLRERNEKLRQQAL